MKASYQYSRIFQIKLMIKREITVFLIVGFITVLVDFLSYRTLIRLEFININLSKAISFLTGSFFSYAANRFFTFKDNIYMPLSFWRFTILYLSTLVLNVFINLLILNIFSNFKNSFKFAFLLATCASACLNFLGMKYFVFKSKVRLKCE